MSMNEMVMSGLADEVADEVAVAAVGDAFQEFLMELGFTGDIPVRATEAAIKERALQFIRERDEALSTKRDQELCCTLITMMDRWALPTDDLWDRYRAGTLKVRPLLNIIASLEYGIHERMRNAEARVAELEAEIATLKGQQP